MQYRLDKKSNTKLSALGMGCMRLPKSMGTPDLKKADSLIMDAISKGINFFDAAYIYPGSEAALGHVLAKNNVREKVHISTKLPIFLCKTYEDFDKYFNIQLERLKTDYIDYYFIHALPSFTEWNRLKALNIEKWLEEKRAQGKIRQVGFSFHGVTSEFLKLVDDRDWDFCMIQYNYINTHYQAGTEGLKYANSKGIPVFIMEPLLGGRLADNLPQKAVQLMKSKDPSSTPAEWALRWVLNQEEVTMVLSGMSSFNQIEENSALMDRAEVGNMSGEELALIDQVVGIFSESYKVPCTGCNYCLPCPSGINIPACFTSYNTSYAISRVSGLSSYATSIGPFSAAPAFISTCIKCGKCEKHCPQNIKIVETLEDVRKRIEPFWFKWILAIIRRFAK